MHSGNCPGVQFKRFLKYRHTAIQVRITARHAPMEWDKSINMIKNKSSILAMAAAVKNVLMECLEIIYYRLQQTVGNSKRRR